MERNYETIFILRPTLNDQEIAESIENYRNLLIREGAEIFKEEDLGKKKLAYEIKHFQNGHYAIFVYRSKPSAVSELERTFKISEDLLRYLTVKIDSLPEPEPQAAEVPETAETAETTESPEAAGTPGTEGVAEGAEESVQSEED